MSSTTTTTTLTITLASFLVASGIGALMPGGADAASGTLTRTSITTIVSARQVLPTVVAAELPVDATVINADTPEQHDLVVWALSRFEEAGLELPVMTVFAHSGKEECKGLNGFLEHAAGGGFEIHTCGAEFTLLHELAHAWDIYRLDDATRSEVLEIAHATEWRNPDNWHLAGGEHAANVVAWALMPTRINQTRTRPYGHASMMQVFSLLTDGGEPLWLTDGDGA